MRTLRDIKCHVCGKDEIFVVPYRDDEEYVVSHGECQNCFANIVLPQEDFVSFVKQHCK